MTEEEENNNEKEQGQLAESFHFQDITKGKIIALTSSVYSVVDLANLAGQVLELQPLKDKSQPDYTG